MLDEDFGEVLDSLCGAQMTSEQSCILFVPLNLGIRSRDGGRPIDFQRLHIAGLV